MKSWLKKYAFTLILLTLGLATRFIGISHPADVVWDEQHFGRFTKGYIEGKYFFDIHPPLGKFILLSSLKLAHADPGDFDFAIGTKYPSEYPYVAARFWPAILGSILPLMVYLLARALTLSPKASFFAGMLILLDNAIFAESHYALIDIFVLVFSFAGLFFFLKHRASALFSRTWWLWLVLASLGGALAVSVKWTGIGALAVMGILTVIESFEKRSAKLFLGRLAVLAGMVAAVYIPMFWLHFRLLPDSGPGDAFMSGEFRASLRGSAEQKAGEITPPTFWEKLGELNKKMFLVNAGQNLTHPDSSRFYEWPVGRKRIYFWMDKADQQKRIFLIANPVVWLFGSVMLVAGVVFLALRRRRLRELLARNGEWRARMYSLEFLLLLYFANWVPFAAISRAMFLYHYFTSLVASVILGAFFLFELVPALSGSQDTNTKSKGSPYLFWILLGLAAMAFLLFSPLSYGYRPFFS